MYRAVFMVCLLACFLCAKAFHEPSCKNGQPLSDVFCGRGPNRQDCPSGYFCHVHPADAWAVCCPTAVSTGSRLKRSNTQLDSLRNKLSNLQDLLKNMETDSKKTLPTTTVLPDNINKAKESMMTNSQNGNSKLDKYKLSPEEVAILMALKNTLNRQQHNKVKADSKILEELKNKETYYDKPIIEDGGDDVAVLKALASRLSEHKETKSEPLNEKDNLSDNSHPQPKEGKFSLFRAEVLAQIEDRLLQDIEFAVKMGFSVAEILKDLQEKEKRFKELQLADMKHRIEELQKIRD